MEIHFMIKDVEELKNKTGLSQIECKEALEETYGNVTAAELILLTKIKDKKATAFSEFIRNATDEEKEALYQIVLEVATKKEQEKLADYDLVKSTHDLLVSKNTVPNFTGLV